MYDRTLAYLRLERRLHSLYCTIVYPTARFAPRGAAWLSKTDTHTLSRVHSDLKLKLHATQIATILPTAITRHSSNTQTLPPNPVPHVEVSLTRTFIRRSSSGSIAAKLGFCRSTRGTRYPPVAKSLRDNGVSSNRANTTATKRYVSCFAIKRPGQYVFPPPNG